MAPKKPKEASFILRNVDGTTWSAFKERAEGEGRSMRWIILRLIAYYVRHGMPEGAAS